MSVQFGRWNFDGQAPAPDYIEKVSATLAPFGPDSDESYSKGGVKILYRAFHTTKESHRETQPHISTSDVVITWDGRLDNRGELIGELCNSLIVSSTDVEIVAAAYEKWGMGCFSKLIGDWALSIWNPRERSLILAKDFVGTRHLYYSIDKDHVVWSTLLDPLVLFGGKTLSICEDYVAGWLSPIAPAAHLSPYIGIHGVPPSSVALLRPGKHTVSRYWDFDPSKKIRYRTDAEYEEHFRTTLATAIHRRLRSDRPVLAELSGGMDSSSIVCMADVIIARGQAGTPRLDTISWYDDSNPGLDERPYFTKVEEQRGRTGYHVDLGSLKAVALPTHIRFGFQHDRFAVTPRPNNYSEFYKRYVSHITSQGYRVVLSGTGGNEVTGGHVPTPTPELQNLLARAHLFLLARQLNAWAVKMRTYRFPLLWEAIQGFLPCVRVSKDMPADSWFHSGFVRRNHAALWGCPSRTKLFGALPSFQENMRQLDIVRRFVASHDLLSESPFDIRYPYVDRGLLEFMYAIPWEQIVRVGQRRSLMKRALIGIVPKELLDRRQKSFVPAPNESTSTEWPSLMETGQHILSSSIGIVDGNHFLNSLREAQSKHEFSIQHFRHTLTLEYWLRHLATHGVLANPSNEERKRKPLLHWK